MRTLRKVSQKESYLTALGLRCAQGTGADAVQRARARQEGCVHGVVCTGGCIRGVCIRVYASLSLVLDRFSPLLTFLTPQAYCGEVYY